MICKMLMLNNCRHHVNENLQRRGVMDWLRTGYKMPLKHGIENCWCLTTGLNLKQMLKRKGIREKGNLEKIIMD